MKISRNKQNLGPLGRAGAFTERHSTGVIVAWVTALVFFAAFAPRAEHALSGAGWEARGSESVAARTVIDREFGGFGAYALAAVVQDGSVARVSKILENDPAVASVAQPVFSRDGKTAIRRAGAGADANEMVRAADRLKVAVAGAGGNLTGSPAMWSDFNAANRAAMAKSELISWPVTMVILLLAFGALVAAGLPLMLTIVSLMAAAGSLYLLSLLTPISIWSMNFAMMFALALGIDYALFVVHRFRSNGSVAETMDTAGKAVLLSGLTVLVSLSAVMLIPSPAFRSTSLGIMLAVTFVLFASLSLLPAVLAKLGTRVDKLSFGNGRAREFSSERFERWGDLVGRRPLAVGAPVALALVLLALPLTGLKTAMPSISVVPQGDASRTGYEQIASAFGEGATAPLQVVAPARDVTATRTALVSDSAVASVSAPVTRGERAMLAVTLDGDSTGATIERLRAVTPPGTLIGGVSAESHDLEQVLKHRTWLVIGVVLALSFALLLFALRAPLIAAAAVLANLLATAAAFGAAKWVFQDGALAGLLGFEPQGFLDAWAPVFFFSMIFAISMDYTVFLLSAAKEHWDRSGDARAAMIGGLAQSGRVIFAAGAVMVAVFFTFALSGPLPPKEMGLILGFAVLLDTMLVRLVLIPVAMRLLGARAWHVPRWVDRALPAVRFGHA